MPDISVIIPVYNVAKYLAKCLDSICKQTLSDIEIICINDCSTDDSLEILRNYAKKDKRVQIIDLKENQGAAVARNKGLEIARGEYLGFVDPDDYIDLNFYEELYKKAQETRADIVKGNVKKYCLDGKIFDSDEQNYQIKENKFYFFYNWWTAIYKRTLIDNNKINFPEECPKAQDVVFLTRCVIYAKSISVADTISYHHVKRENSLNSLGLSSKHAYSAIKAGEIILNELNEALSHNLISEADYALVYANRIMNVLIYTYYLIFDLDIKKHCAFKVLELYDKCLVKNLFDDEFKYKYMLSIIKKNNVEELCKLLNKYVNLEACYRDEFLFSLRQNVKRNIHNA